MMGASFPYTPRPFLTLPRSSLPGIDSSLSVIWVMHATPQGEVVTPLPGDASASSSAGAGHSGRRADWLLLDGLQVGHPLDQYDLTSPGPPLCSISSFKM